MTTTPCLQPFESEIGYINKALALFSPFLFFIINAKLFNVPHLRMKFRAMKLTKRNLLALKCARSTIYFPSLSGGDFIFSGLSELSEGCPACMGHKQPGRGRWAATGTTGKVTDNTDFSRREGKHCYKLRTNSKALLS